MLASLNRDTNELDSTQNTGHQIKQSHLTRVAQRRILSSGLSGRWSHVTGLIVIVIIIARIDYLYEILATAILMRLRLRLLISNDNWCVTMVTVVGGVHARG